MQVVMAGEKLVVVSVKDDRLDIKIKNYEEEKRDE